ncbi:hypothetical protein BLNAU_2252 [Blattamonas nauphoetae]|uniref:Uncharacterized protein n=1 Tax=Blattamonas nauphoetae TaxID=2049346 RepID=A0ABQ9YGD0_9EUKA|nr:hypothetical protein BLNAU_2252 [Blattamonas nauphoetae]
MINVSVENVENLNNFPSVKDSHYSPPSYSQSISKRSPIDQNIKSSPYSNEILRRKRNNETFDITFILLCGRKMQRDHRMRYECYSCLKIVDVFINKSSLRELGFAIDEAFDTVQDIIRRLPNPITEKDIQTLSAALIQKLSDFVDRCERNKNTNSPLVAKDVQDIQQLLPAVLRNLAAVYRLTPAETIHGNILVLRLYNALTPNPEYEFIILNPVPTLLTCFFLAIKLNRDGTYPTSKVAKLFSVLPEDFKHFERLVISALDFNLQVSESEFESILPEMLYPQSSDRRPSRRESQRSPITSSKHKANMRICS